MKKWIIVSIVALAAVAAAVAFFALRGGEDVEPQNKPKVTERPRGKRGDRVKRGPQVGRERGLKKGKSESGAIKAAKKKPTFALDDDDEANLNEEQRKMIEAIRAALSDDDRKTVLKLVNRLQKSPEWPDGIPKSIKLAAIEALGWFGSSCLPELAGFLADADGEVVDAAIERYEEMLGDFDLSDRERANILVEASKIINDSEAMDSMLFELNNMRHSVAVETIKRLMAEGNAATKSILPENVEFYTGEEGLNTPEKLDEWLKQNPDDEDDEESYGGAKAEGKNDEESSDGTKAEGKDHQ